MNCDSAMVFWLLGHGSCLSATRIFHKKSSDLFGAELTEPVGNTEDKAGVTEIKALLLFLVCCNQCPAHETTKCIPSPR